MSEIGYGIFVGLISAAFGVSVWLAVGGTVTWQTPAAMVTIAVVWLAVSIWRQRQ